MSIHELLWLKVASILQYGEFYGIYPVIVDRAIGICRAKQTLLVLLFLRDQLIKKLTQKPI